VIGYLCIFIENINIIIIIFIKNIIIYQ